MSGSSTEDKTVDFDYIKELAQQKQKRSCKRQHVASLKGQ